MNGSAARLALRRRQSPAPERVSRRLCLAANLHPAPTSGRSFPNNLTTRSDTRPNINRPLRGIIGTGVGGACGHDKSANDDGRNNPHGVGFGSGRNCGGCQRDDSRHRQCSDCSRHCQLLRLDRFAKRAGCCAAAIFWRRPAKAKLQVARRNHDTLRLEQHRRYPTIAGRQLPRGPIGARGSLERGLGQGTM